jgi:hypothetical protein
MNTNVYVATLPRSGSTLLGMMINQHHLCFNMGESFFWGKFIPTTLDFINIFPIFDSSSFRSHFILTIVNLKLSLDILSMRLTKCPERESGYFKLSNIY